MFFTTDERLVNADTDIFPDIYERSGGTTTLVSAGEINGNGANNAVLGGASSDGSKAFFNTTEQLVSADTDSSQDLYERSGGTTTLVSAGEINGNGELAAIFSGASSDGSKVFFITFEQLVSADTDSSQDVYERSGGTTTRVSAGEINGNGAIAATFSGASSDGSKVFFTTAEQLVSADTDSSQDVYERSGGTTTRVSAGEINGNGGIAVTFSGASSDGSKVFFSTAEQLVSADTDSAADVYERASGTTKLVSANLDEAPPETTIDSGPADGAITNDTTPTFGFSSNEAGSTFQCSLVAQGQPADFATPCSGPGDTHTPSPALSDGPYTVSVRAKDAANNTDPTPASRNFTVDTIPPSLSITSGPTGPTNNQRPTFGFTAEPGSTVECSVDQGGANFAACSAAGSHQPASNLADGNWTFRVRATDVASNTDTKTQAFSVDTTPAPADPAPGGDGGGDSGGGEGDGGGGGDQTPPGGTDSDDSIDGTEQADVIDGLAGDDLITGGLGDDRLMGGLGDDEVAGGDNDDDVSGGDGDDIIRGGKGKDKLDGEAGNDSVFGGRGKDKVEAADGETDVVSCGKGPDTVNADPQDEIGKNCEKVK